MALQRALYISPLVLALFFSAGLAGFAWRRRKTAAGALQFFLLMVAVFVWDAAYICELFSPDLPTALFMVNVKYLGIASIPVLWLLYVLRYTGHERWALPRWQIVWFVIPTLTILFSLTNPYHEWMRRVTGFDTDGLFSQVLKIYGPWFWVHTVYSYVVLLVATVLILHSAFFARGLVFRQKILLLIAVLLPWAGNALYIFGVSMLDLTPPAFAVMGLLMLVAVSRFQLFNIVPVARETLVDSMTDAVVVLNMQNKVVDANPASEKITCLPVSKVIGMGAADVFTGYFGMITFYDPEMQVHNEIVVAEGAEPLYYDLQIIPLKSSHRRLIGRMVVLRDITQHRRAEKALQKLNEQLEEKVNERTDALLRELAEREKIEGALRVSEERYALAMRGANDGIWDWDLRADTLYYSPRWKAMFGYREGEIGNSPQEWFHRIHPDDAQRVQAEIARHLQNPDTDLYSEFRMLHKDGWLVWVLCRGVAVRDENGVPYRMAGSITDITLRKQTEEEVLRHTFHDILTGLPNRSLLVERLNHAIERAKRRERDQFAVLYLDLDRFKNINESLGHFAGDRLLVQCGKRLLLSVRTVDMVARFGGDEFVILVEDVETPDDVLRIVERVQENMASPFRLPEREVFVTASIGVVFYASNYEKAEEILRDAEVAMYEAKLQGAARYALFDAEMRRKAVVRLELENDLRKALERGEFVLNYQPIIEIGTNRLVGLEALIRWQHPRRGLILPMVFVPIAEETGLIVAIGKWVLQQACLQMCDWLVKYPQMKDAVMHVNVSARQFNQPNLYQMVEQVLSETGLPPGNLALEVTESVLIENYDPAVALLHALRRVGVQLEIDDFGTGYSSLTHLHRLPVNVLKIDRGFISRMCVPGDSSAEIVQAIIALAKEIGKKVIAEGVETPEELHKLKELGCRYAQGFLISEAVDALEAESLIHSWKSVASA